MRRLRVLKVIDRWGWAYDFVGREQARYSKHEIIMRPWDQAAALLGVVDLVYLHGPNICEYVRRELPCEARAMGVPVIGGYGGESSLLYGHCDAVICISPQTFEFAASRYTCRRYFITEGIDTEYWKPAPGVPCDADAPLRVGWAGREHSEKRPHLLDRLKYPVRRQADRNPELFRPDRSLNPMRKFYRSIDVLVLTSKTECMPRVVLEAMACGLPVVSTKVGNVSSVLGPAWLAPVDPEQAVIDGIDSRLDLLQDAELRRMVGRRNRQIAESHASWRVLAPQWDAAFEEIAQ